MKAAFLYGRISIETFERVRAALGIDTVVLGVTLTDNVARESIEHCPSDLDIILQLHPLSVSFSTWVEPLGTVIQAAKADLVNLAIKHLNIRGLIIAHEFGIRAGAKHYLSNLVLFCEIHGIDPILLLDSPAEEQEKVPATMDALVSLCSVWAEVKIWSWALGKMNEQQQRAFFSKRADEILALDRPACAYDAIMWQVCGDRVPNVQTPREQATDEQLTWGMDELQLWKNRFVWWMAHHEPPSSKYTSMLESDALCSKIKDWWKEEEPEVPFLLWLWNLIKRIIRRLKEIW